MLVIRNKSVTNKNLRLCTNQIFGKYNHNPISKYEKIWKVSSASLFLPLSWVRESTLIQEQQWWWFNAAHIFHKHGGSYLLQNGFGIFPQNLWNKTPCPDTKHVFASPWFLHKMHRQKVIYTGPAPMPPLFRRKFQGGPKWYTWQTHLLDSLAGINPWW